ncbi:MAG TPA: peptide deformylase [Opitutaceae bacterium]|nr:peptide deformylase [Opitutaceae bacterium]
MLLPIVRYNQPVLRKKGAQVTVFDAALRKLADDMVETMHEAEGIGLAAQQIGQAIQFCVVDLRPTEAEFDWELDGRKPPLDLFMPMAIANPRITFLPGKETSYEEGCLSFPGIRGDVIRPDAIRVEFQDADGATHTLTCTGLFSRCIQHEADHLNGILFIDQMAKRVAVELKDDLKALEKETKAAAKKQAR